MKLFEPSALYSFHLYEVEIQLKRPNISPNIRYVRIL